MDVTRIILHARTGSYFPPGNNGDGSVSLSVPPPSAIQGLISAVTGEDISGISVGWCMKCSGIMVDYEKIVPARKKPKAEDFESYSTGYHLVRTPIKRTILVDPILMLYVPNYLEQSFRHPYYGLKMGRSQDIAWIDSICPNVIMKQIKTDEYTEVEGIVCPFPIPHGGIAGAIWLMHRKSSGFEQRSWSNPSPFVILEKRQIIRGLANMYMDIETGLSIPMYEL